MKIKNIKAVSSITNTTLDANAQEQQGAFVAESNNRFKSLSHKETLAVVGGSGSGDGVWPTKPPEKTESSDNPEPQFRSGSGDGIWPKKKENP